MFRQGAGFGWAMVALGALCMAGCVASYKVPGPAADMKGLFPPAAEQATDPDLRGLLAVRPAAPFPANLAVVRVQAPTYRAYDTETYGHGRFTLVRGYGELETNDRLTKLAAMPQVADVALVSTLLVAPQLDSDKPLREAAARLHADLLLIYTLDTRFYVKNPADPLDVVSLGLFPTKNVRLDCTASAVLMDTRTGYVYGLAEATAREKQPANLWSTEDATDAARRRAESAAMDDLLIGFEKMWRETVAAYGAGGPAAQLARQAAATQVAP